MCLCLFATTAFFISRGSGEFGHGQDRGPWQRGKIRRWTSHAETMHLSVRWRGTIAGRARMGWVGVQSSRDRGTGSAGRAAEAPAGKEIPTNSLCGENVGGILADVFPLRGHGKEPGDWWEAEDLPGRAGPLAGAMRTQREIPGHMLGYNNAVKMDGDGPIFGLRTSRREERNRSFYRQGPRTQEQEGTQSKATSEAEACCGIFLDGTRDTCHLSPLLARMIEVFHFSHTCRAMFFICSHLSFSFRLLSVPVACYPPSNATTNHRL